MPRVCHKVKMENGGVAFITTEAPRNRSAPCDFCTTVHQVLCDFPLRGKRAGRTCSKRLCKTDTTEIGDNLDLCPPHAKLVRELGIGDRLSALLDDKNRGGHAVALDLIDEMTIGSNTPKPPTWKPRDLADWQEFVRERAAIGEYVGELTREAAEKQALAEAGPRPKA